VNPAEISVRVAVISLFLRIAADERWYCFLSHQIKGLSFSILVYIFMVDF
jgi:hypothetical protein